MVWFICTGHYLSFTIFFAAVILFSDITINFIIHQEENNLLAYAHIFSDTPNTITKNIDNYLIVFLPYPNIPLVNDNSTRLNFSLTENKTDVYNVFVSLIIKERSSGNVVEQIPYKFYEFGDITFPEVNPLIANFDISVVKPGEIPFNVWVISLTPIVAAIAGIAIYVDFFKKGNNRSRSTTT